MNKRLFFTKIITKFNDGTQFIGNEIQTALVCGFTEKSRKGILVQLYCDFDIIEDYE